jgi:dipeptidyl aminopeptidase/acylaminoacyl peptidase
MHMLRNRIALLATLILAGFGESRHESSANAPRSPTPVAAAPDTTTVIQTAEPRGCGAPSRPDPAADLAWVRARTPIYRLTSAGEFAVGGFDGRTWKPLYSHLQTDDWPELRKSPGGRWIVYVTGSTDANRKEHWLFDVRAQSERRIATVPLHHVSDPEFSPSGDTLAYYVSYDSRWTQAGEIGLNVIDSASGAASYLGYPVQSRIAAQEGHGFISWSADGRSILLHLVGHTPSGFAREFHRLDIGDRKFRRIEGVYDKRERGERFIENGRDIAQHLNDDSKTRRWFGELEAPSRQLHAHIDEQHRLVVRDAAGRERVVDRGTYEQCEGETIGIIDWVDDDRYLVYRISGEHYIADPRTGQRALLFDSAPPDAAYVW